MNKIVGKLIFGLLLSSSIKAQVNDGFEINGKIAGLKEGEKVTLRLSLGKGFKENIDWVRYDSAYVKKGSFRISGRVPEGPRFFWMMFDQHPDKAFRFIMANHQKIRISSDSDIASIHHDFLDDCLKFEGSPTTEAWKKLISIDALYWQSIAGINHYLRVIKDSIGFDPLLAEGAIRAKESVNRAAYVTYLSPDDPVVQSILPFYIWAESLVDMSGHSPFFKDVYDNLPDSIKKSYYGKILNENLRLLRGQAFPPFSLPDISGTSIAVKDISQKNKITLVLFWATNSYKSDEFIEEIQHYYDKYHSKGLAVIGVSSDTNSVKWKKKVEVEQYPWYNVSDPNGKKGIVETVYHEYNNPKIPNTTKVLIDSNGKIVSWDPDGVEFQWYLWKYFGN